MMPGEGGKKIKDAGTDLLANRVSAIETKANVVRRSRQSSDENALLRKLRVDGKLDILRAQRRNITR